MGRFSRTLSVLLFSEHSGVTHCRYGPTYTLTYAASVNLDTPTVSRLERHEAADAQAALTAAFTEQPPYDMLFRHNHRAAVDHVLGYVIALSMSSGHVNITRDPQGRIDGVAAWLAPGYAPLPWYRGAPGLMHAVRGALRAGANGAKGLARFTKAIDRHHPSEPHWYLFTIGVRPDRQGHHQGTALLRHQLAIADMENLPAYLDTQKEANVGFYRRFGFDDYVPASPVEGMTCWYLYRPARNPAPSGRD